MASEEVNEADMQEAGEEMDTEDRRVNLTVQGKVFFPSHIVTSCITSIWKAQFTGLWDTWKSIPQTEKDNWFDAFKATYKWDRTIDHRVKKVFNHIGGKSFRNFMCKARKKPEVKPKFINLSTWQELCRKTRLPEFIVKSNRGKVARQANKRLHTGGSVSIVEHQRRLRDELGREPFAGETFARTHKHKDDTFVDDEAQETWESYNEKHGLDDPRDAQSGNVSNSYTRWANHVGIKNGSFYGGGSGVDRYILQGSNMNESSTSALNNQDWNHVQDRVEQQESEIALIREEQARLRATQEVQNEKLDQVLQFQSSFEDTTGNIIARKVRKVVAKEVKRVISQEVGKVISQEVGKANRQFLDGLQRRH